MHNRTTFTNYVVHQRTVPRGKIFENSSKVKVYIIGESHLEKINKKKIKVTFKSVGKMVSLVLMS